MTLPQRLHEGLELADLPIDIVPPAYAFQQQRVLLFLFVLILEEVAVNIYLKVELDAVLHFDDSQLLVVVGSLDEEEQVIGLTSYPNILTNLLALVLHLEVELLVQGLVEAVMHWIQQNPEELRFNARFLAIVANLNLVSEEQLFDRRSYWFAPQGDRACAIELLLLGAFPVRMRHLCVVLSVDDALLQPRNELETDLAKVLFLAVADLVAERVHQVAQNIGRV